MINFQRHTSMSVSQHWISLITSQSYLQCMHRIHREHESFQKSIDIFHLKNLLKQCVWAETIYRESHWKSKVRLLKVCRLKCSIVWLNVSQLLIFHCTKRKTFYYKWTKTILCGHFNNQNEMTIEKLQRNMKENLLEGDACTNVAHRPRNRVQRKKMRMKEDKRWTRRKQTKQFQST